MSDADTDVWDVTIEIPADADLEEAGETHTIRVGSEEYILAAAREQGLWVPADCQQGWCITCAATVLEGDVDQSDAKRYYSEDADADFALICTAKPNSDVTLKVGAHEELLRHRADTDRPPGSSKL
ncbi:ferredoxin (2Fe-2S) [Natronomonas moolapensis 8.8.11]|uniref:Ferredoxin (2Fe-2S) n=1 Tax=Natronomonas moolapensis (strain DSM 18674 / CECT 7526 / JCM 14361 / 8.8.11) TaxID=268739 RepID=M1Y2I8_NATM8|nr:2Fe-2S iron-sulfur cluster binding domain-containing protein [Natronomonas moolapensis]CCQ36716.1 ferredoxin (2Fe-2S) [Natronomonas moolapensis 8.8.11]